MKLFVYGTLKKGQYNHHLLMDSKYLYDTVIKGFTLYDVGYGYPFAVKKEGSFITGEVYEVDQEIYQIIEDMELYARYSVIETKDMILFYAPSIKSYSNPIDIGSTWK